MSDTPMVERLAAIIEAKQGDKDLAIFYVAPYGQWASWHPKHGQEFGGGWSIHLGNPSACVGLGEIDGEIVTEEHPTMEAALDELEKLVSEANAS